MAQRTEPLTLLLKNTWLQDFGVSSSPGKDGSGVLQVQEH